MQVQCDASQQVHQRWMSRWHQATALVAKVRWTGIHCRSYVIPETAPVKKVKTRLKIDEQLGMLSAAASSNTEQRWAQLNFVFPCWYCKRRV